MSRRETDPPLPVLGSLPSHPPRLPPGARLSTPGRQHPSMHSQGLQIVQPLEAVRPQMLDAVVMKMPV